MGCGEVEVPEVVSHDIQDAAYVREFRPHFMTSRLIERPTGPR